MQLKNALVALTAFCAFSAPLVAHADMTASAAPGKISNVSGMGARQSTDVRGNQKADRAILVLAAVVPTACGYGIYKAVDDDKFKGS